jgi:hypothetical protein
VQAGGGGLLVSAAHLRRGDDLAREHLVDQVGGLGVGNRARGTSVLEEHIDRAFGQLRVNAVDLLHELLRGQDNVLHELNTEHDSIARLHLNGQNPTKCTSALAEPAVEPQPLDDHVLGTARAHEHVEEVDPVLPGLELDLSAHTHFNSNQQFQFL